MAMAMFWSYANRQNSSGSYRNLMFYLLPVFDMAIFTLRSIVHLLYLLLVGRSPPPFFQYLRLVTP